MSDAVASSLDAAEKEKLTSVGMTLMGSGEFGWEADVAASVMVKALLSWARLTGSSQIKQVIHSRHRIELHAQTHATARMHASARMYLLCIHKSTLSCTAGTTHRLFPLLIFERRSSSSIAISRRQSNSWSPSTLRRRGQEAVAQQLMLQV